MVYISFNSIRDYQGDAYEFVKTDISDFQFYKRLSGSETIIKSNT